MNDGRRQQSVWLTVLCAIVCASSPSAQGGAATEPAKGQDPAVRAKLDAFALAVADKKLARDPEAVRILDELVAGLETMSDKDRKAFVDALESVFSKRYKKRTPKQDGLYRSVASALGTVGGELGSKVLCKVYEAEPFRKKQWIDLREVLLENIGRTGDEKQVEFLLDRATRDPQDRIKAAAGQALGHFAGAKLELRKEIVGALVVDYGKIEGGSKGGMSTETATRKKTLSAIRGPWNETLGKLTGQKLGTAVEWNDWLNEHKDDKSAWGGGGTSK